MTIAGNIVGVDDTSNEDITIVAGASSGTDGGTITLGGTVGTEIRAVTLTAGTAINLGGDITTINVTGNNVDINGPAILTANVDIDTSLNDGSIDFSSTINNAASGGPFNLQLDTGSGAIGVTGVIGGSASIGTIDINQTDGAGVITLAGIGNGTTAAGNTGQVDIGNSATADLNLAGTFFTNGQTTYEASSTAGATDENIDITATTTFKTSDDAIIFSTAAIDIANTANLTIDTGTGAITLTDIHGDGTTDTTDLDLSLIHI